MAFLHHDRSPLAAVQSQANRPHRDFVLNAAAVPRLDSKKELPILDLFPSLLTSASVMPVMCNATLIRAMA